jgi:hypothetical protein
LFLVVITAINPVDGQLFQQFCPAVVSIDSLAGSSLRARSVRNVVQHAHFPLLTFFFIYPFDCIDNNDINFNTPFLS